VRSGRERPEAHDAHVRGQGFASLSAVPYQVHMFAIVQSFFLFVLCLYRGSSEKMLFVVFAIPSSASWAGAHERRVIHDQARHEARSEDASARSADEGRRPAPIRPGSRSQAVSRSSPNGATPARSCAQTPVLDTGEVSGGTETSQYPEEDRILPE
jgi:hypothetical protein